MFLAASWIGWTESLQPRTYPFSKESLQKCIEAYNDGCSMHHSVICFVLHGSDTCRHLCYKHKLADIYAIHWCDLHQREFPWESVSERILKIGVYLADRMIKSQAYCFFETQCICCIGLCIVLDLVGLAVIFLAGRSLLFL